MTRPLDYSLFTPENAHQEWRHRIRNHVAAKRVIQPTEPNDLSLDIAKFGVEVIVDQILDDPRTLAEVPPSWVKRDIITKAVESLIYDPKITPEPQTVHDSADNQQTA